MRRLLLLIAALALALAAGGHGAVTAAEVPGVGDPADSACSVFVPSADRYCAPIPLPAEATGVATTFAPADPDLYEALIPAPFSAPDSVEDYRVGLLIFWLEIPPSAGEGSHEGQYVEGAYSLWAQRDGKHGWYHLHVPVSDSSLYDAGRAAGLPKYLADISVVPDDDGWRALANGNDPAGRGPAVVDLDWDADAAAPTDDRVAGFVTQREVFFGTCPHLDGRVPDADYEPSRWWESKYTTVPNSLTHPPQAGTVTVAVDPTGTLDWAGLLPGAPADGSAVHVFDAPGMFWHAEGVVVATWDPQGTDGGPANCD